jgi:hypothetical protein
VGNLVDLLGGVDVLSICAYTCRVCIVVKPEGEEVWFQGFVSQGDLKDVDGWLVTDQSLRGVMDGWVS